MLKILVYKYYMVIQEKSLEYKMTLKTEFEFLDIFFIFLFLN